MAGARNWKVALISLAVLTLLVLVEAAWSRRQEREVYDRRETRENLLIFVGMRFSSLVLSGWVFFALRYLSGLAPRTLAPTGLSFLAAVIGFDFLYYWQHRLLHLSSVLWPFHAVHHQARHFNFTAALRLPWITSLLSPFFYAPLALFGIPLTQIGAAAALNLMFQFFQHTQAVGRLPFVEGILNTPAAHRVHHATNPCYRDRNFGGVLMIWDRWFGTYQAEKEGVQEAYGSDGVASLGGVLRSVFGDFSGLARGDGFRPGVLGFLLVNARGLVVAWIASGIWVAWGS